MNDPTPLEEHATRLLQRGWVRGEGGEGWLLPSKRKKRRNARWFTLAEASTEQRRRDAAEEAPHAR